MRTIAKDAVDVVVDASIVSSMADTAKDKDMVRDQNAQKVDGCSSRYSTCQRMNKKYDYVRSTTKRPYSKRL
ncbi:hypothetical protein TELCIR_16855 [Teladorsagia circumcincta]|uniref:Uncharacterized protein n=1 Tax=Teladorsagia circumcincta TaxID=45464 RepID=A0A2G9TUN8_TELCI|nr:hypothetical protein TELCIR_16855 [Teladorsagia circumcincta]